MRVQTIFFPPFFFFLINIYVCIYILYLYVQSKTHLREDPRSSIKFLFSIYRLIRGKKIYSVTIYDEYYDTLTSQKFGDMFVDRHVHGFKRNLHTFIFILFFFFTFFIYTNDQLESVYQSHHPIKSRSLSDFERILIF